MGRTRLLAATAAAVLVGVLAPAATTAALADPGDLDPSFGNAGTVAFPAGGDANLQGTLLAHSSLGTVLAQNSTTYSPFGGALSQVVVRRLGPQGTLDPTFGSAGSTVVDVGQPAFVRDLVVTHDDRTLLLLSVGDGSLPQQLGLVRLLRNGTLDPGYGTDGVVVVPSEDGRAPVAVLPRGDGSVLVGLAENGQGSSDFAMQAYDVHGVAVGSLRTVDIGGYDVLTDLVAGPHGSYYAVGSSAKPSGQAAAAVRLLRDGSPDPSFGVGGIARVASRGRGLATVGALAYGSSLLMYGSAQAGADFDGFVARLSAAGVPAAGFGDGGLLLLGTPGLLETVTAVAASSPGQAVAAVAIEGGASSGLLAQFGATDGVLDAGYGRGGELVLPGRSFHELLADGDALLLAGTRYGDVGPVEIVQRRLDQ